MKTIIVLVLVALLGTFIVIKVQVAGDPNSGFNQSTRFTMGEHPLLRTLFGLHNPGDARDEYFHPGGSINIEWFLPEEDTTDQPTLQKFANMVANYTGRQVKLVYGGAVSDDVLPVSNLRSFVLKAYAQRDPGGSVMAVFLLQDYTPRLTTEFSGTYQELGITVSMGGLTTFLQEFPENYNKYLLANLLRGFGSQIGLPTSNDPNCIMSPLQINGQPLEMANGNVPQDFCSQEVSAINQIKLNSQ